MHFMPCSKGDKHILVSTMNHAGLDALNAFVIYNSFLNYISLLSAGDPPEIPGNTSGLYWCHIHILPLSWSA